VSEKRKAGEIGTEKRPEPAQMPPESKMKSQGAVEQRTKMKRTRPDFKKITKNNRAEI